MLNKERNYLRIFKIILYILVKLTNYQFMCKKQKEILRKVIPTLNEINKKIIIKL